jgi:hypothetical protein
MLWLLYGRSVERISPPIMRVVILVIQTWQMKLYVLALEIGIS